MQESEKEILYLMVDPTTGEIVNDICIGDKIIHKDTLDKKFRIPNSYVMDFNKDKNFVKLFDTTVSALNAKLNASEFATAIALCQFVSYADCMLRFGGHNNGEPMNVRHIAESLGREYTRFSRQFNSLISKGIVGRFTFETGDIETGEKKKVSGYFVNPYIYCRGNKVNKTVLKLFEDTGWKEFINNK